jgi:hypothetical protein
MPKKMGIGFYLLTYKREGRLANLVVVSAESLTEARLRCAPGLGDAVLDQVLPLETEIATALPPDLIGKSLDQSGGDEAAARGRSADQTGQMT